MVELTERNEAIYRSYEELKGQGAARRLAKEYNLSERRISQIYYQVKIKKALEKLSKK